MELRVELRVEVCLKVRVQVRVEVKVKVWGLAPTKDAGPEHPLVGTAALAVRPQLTVGHAAAERQLEGGHLSISIHSSTHPYSIHGAMHPYSRSPEHFQAHGPVASNP